MLERLKRSMTNLNIMPVVLLLRTLVVVSIAELDGSKPSIQVEATLGRDA